MRFKDFYYKTGSQSIVNENKVELELDNERQVWAVSVDLEEEADGHRIVPANRVYFEEGESQWWNSEADCLYIGYSFEKAFTSFSDTLKRSLSHHLDQREREDIIQKAQNEVTERMSHLTGPTCEWRVQVADNGSRIVSIGVEIDVAGFTRTKDLETGVQQAQEDPDLSELF